MNDQRFADSGLTWRAPFADRVNDTAGIGLGYARTSTAGALQAGLPGVHGAETILELTYQAQLTPWFQVQPDFQYVFSPGSLRRTRTARVGPSGMPRFLACEPR